MRFLPLLLVFLLGHTDLFAQFPFFRKEKAPTSSGPAAPSPGNIATVRPGDTFEVRLGGVPVELAQEFNIGYTVSQDGTVNVPNLGPLHVAGLTPPGVEKLIQDQLVAGKIFTHPSVNINPGGNRTVIIGGGVRNPGRQPWFPDLTAGSAIRLAGGPTDFGTLRGLKIVRDGQVMEFDGRKFAANPALDPKLLPGDQVIVRE